MSIYVQSANFSGLNFHGYNPMEYSWEYFCSELARSDMAILTIKEVFISFAENICNYL